MPTRSHTRVLHSLQTQGTFPIIIPYPSHCLIVIQLVSRLLRHGGVRPLLQIRGLRSRVCRSVEEERIVGAVCIGVEGNLGATADYGACAHAGAQGGKSVAG